MATFSSSPVRAAVDCGSLGYTGTLEGESGYISVVAPGGESNKLACRFNS